ncbi:MAG: tetratricopeptide repeat protein [Bacteroidota bacterium]
MKNKFLLIGIGYLLAILLLIGSSLIAQVVPNNDSAAHYLKLAQIDKQNGRRLDLLKRLDKAMAFQSQDPATLRELGSLLAGQRKFGQALELFKTAISLSPKDTSLLRQTLQLAYQLRQQEEVIRLADLYIKADPKAAVSIYLGKVYYEMEDYGKAIQYLTQAGKENPTLAEVPYLLAKSYADMTNFKGAIPFFLKALALDPKQANWTYELGLSYYAIHDDVNALKYIEQAAAVGYKKDNDYLENLAIAYLNVGQFEQGVGILKEVLGRRPSDFNLLNMLAEAYYGKTKFVEAIEYWDRVLEYDKGNASALYMIGMSYQKMGGKQNADKGIALCDKAIEMDPSLSSLKQKKMMAGL